ncbi:MAG: hypothetical protein JW934_09730, partial [Anaerolineae bacterium]|nr:hypothetical protein [Anaerolineae bacterium]
NWRCRCSKVAFLRPVDHFGLWLHKSYVSMNKSIMTPFSPLKASVKNELGFAGVQPNLQTAENGVPLWKELIKKPI